MTPAAEEHQGPFPARTMLPKELQGQDDALDQVTPEGLSSQHQCEPDPAAEEVRNDNDERAERALDALLTYYRSGYSSEVVSAVLGDFLGDLMHLCDAIGADWADYVDRGRTHHDAEIYGVI